MLSNQPHNILVSRGRLKLADFGLSKTLTLPMAPLTREVVTLWYRPPEVLMGLTSEYTSAIDVWSAAVVYVEMGQGKAPFRASSEGAMLRAIHMEFGPPVGWPTAPPPPPVPHTPALVLPRVVRAMFALNPANRPSFEEVLIGMGGSLGNI